MQKLLPLVLSAGLLFTTASAKVIYTYDSVGNRICREIIFSKDTEESKAFTIGHYSIGPKNYAADWRDHLYVHEYGHYIQSQRMGLLYFPVVAGPSLLSAAFTSSSKGMGHNQRWFEVDASYLGAQHFDKKYGSGKSGYIPNDENYFDITAFRSNKSSIYGNPRNNKHNVDFHPTSGSKLVFWDFIL